MAIAQATKREPVRLVERREAGAHQSKVHFIGVSLRLVLVEPTNTAKELHATNILQIYICTHKYIYIYLAYIHVLYIKL